MIYNSLELPRHAASNRTIYMSLAMMDGKIMTFYCLETFANNSLFINAKVIEIVRLDAP